MIAGAIDLKKAYSSKCYMQMAMEIEKHISTKHEEA